MAMENLHNISYNCVPSSVHHLLVGMMQQNPDLRTSAIDIINNACFNTGTLAVLRTIDTLHSKDIGTQASQLSNLPSMLSPCPGRLLEGAVMLSICNLCLNNPGLWVYALPLHVYIAARIPAHSYQQTAAPAIKEGG